MQEDQLASQPNGAGDIHHRRHDKGACRTQRRGGCAHIRAIFRRMRRLGNLGPRGLDPDDTLELRGNGGGQKQATVETILKVRDEHEPGDCLGDNC